MEKEKHCCPKCEIYLDYKEQNMYQCNNAACECHKVLVHSPTVEESNYDKQNKAIDQAALDVWNAPVEDSWEKTIDDFLNVLKDDFTGGDMHDWKYGQERLRPLLRTLIEKERRDTAEKIYGDIQDIFNRCKTERGLSTALSNYLKSLPTNR